MEQYWYGINAGGTFSLHELFINANLRAQIEEADLTGFKFQNLEDFEI
jgi:hypothetical protein